VDPGGNEATINVGGEWGPGPPGEGEDEQLVPSSGDGETFIGWQKTYVEDRLGTTSRYRHAQSTYHHMC
jgi:hypothetical protein